MGILNWLLLVPWPAAVLITTIETFFLLTLHYFAAKSKISPEQKTTPVALATPRGSIRGSISRRKSLGPSSFPPHDAPAFPDKNSAPSFHFWTLITHHGRLAGMRNSGTFADNISLAATVGPNDDRTDLSKPPDCGYKYVNGLPCRDGDVFGSWIDLKASAFDRMKHSFKDASNLDELDAKRKREGKKLKDDGEERCVPDASVDPNTVLGGDGKQLPISISEYKYSDLVADRTPFSLERNFQIKVKLLNKERCEWKGKVGHLDQEFFWKRSEPTMAFVRMTTKDWKTWETDLRELPGVRITNNKEEGDSSPRVEFPTTHLWVDLDKYEMVWFYHTKAIARKKIYVPYVLRGPINFAVNLGFKKLTKGAGYQEGDDDEDEDDES